MPPRDRGVRQVSGGGVGRADRKAPWGTHSPFPGHRRAASRLLCNALYSQARTVLPLGPLGLSVVVMLGVPLAGSVARPPTVPRTGPRTARRASVPPYWGEKRAVCCPRDCDARRPPSCHRGPRALPLPLREEMGAGWGPTCCPRPLASTWHAGTHGMKCAAPEAPPDAEERPEVRRAGHCPRLYELGRCQHLAPHGCRPPAQPASRPQGRTLTDNCFSKREWEQLDPRGRAHSQEVATE